PLDDILTDIGNGAKQGDDHLGTPVGHLAPGQHIAHKGFRHQRQVDRHAKDPHQLPGRLVGTVDQAAKHVQVDYDEECRSPRGVDVAQQPTVIHIPHDVLDGGKGSLGGGVEAHQQPDAGEQLDYQHHQGQNPEEVTETEVLGGLVLAHVGVPCALYWQALVDPGPKSAEQVHYAASSSTPMTMTLSPSNEYGGTSRLVGAGTLL